MSIQVLLSTFNGQQYLRQQLDSLLCQNQIELNILIRDDGSTDNTRIILEEYEKRYTNIKVIYSENVGVKKSFFELIKQASTHDLYALCDQDDVWLPNKLYEAKQKISQEPFDNPILYFSRTTLVDQDLNPLGQWPSVPHKKLSFQNALIENFAVGCTVVFNKSARDLLLIHEPHIDSLIMHDWWMYLCVMSCGKIIYDPRSFIHYRQHSNNIVGGSISFFSVWNNKFKRFVKNGKKKLLKKQAEEFFKSYGHLLKSEDKETLRLFIQQRDTFMKRYTYLSKTDLYKQSNFENFLFKLLILLDRI